jgi:hypothetical protein
MRRWGRRHDPICSAYVGNAARDTGSCSNFLVLMCLRCQLPKVNFTPEGFTGELEDCEVNLDYVASLQLVIKPDLPHNEAIALAAWRPA